MWWGLLELEGVQLGVEEAVRVVNLVGLGDELLVAEREGQHSTKCRGTQGCGGRDGVCVPIAVGEDGVDRLAA